ncbi:MAG: livH2, partial [Deltaproteobacteria bacterium]|nr:livH2 [Deltaproteobacteria bacterium]
MVGAYIGYFIATFLMSATLTGMSFILPGWAVLAITVVVTMALTSLVGVGLERIAYRPLRRKGANRLYVVITALMAGLILENGNLA